MHLWDFGDVYRQITMRRLLAMLVIAGLIAAPLSQPAMGGTTPDASMSAMVDNSMSATDEGDGVAGEMPCCPAKAPASADCDKCVFMAGCMGQCAAGVSAAQFRPPFAVSSKIVPLRNDAWPDGLGRPPPEDPPRPLV
jgi:hypothetical protein